MSRRVIVEADGGSRGNPGPAGWGAVVLDAQTRETLAERAAGIGRATNNVAEYGGLIAGLTAALELDPSSVDVRMDSKLVVEQMSGRWQVKHPDMKPLARQAAGLVARLPQVRFTWIPRAQNSHADRLANEAMDAQAKGHVWRAGGDSGIADAADAFLARAETEPRGAADGTTPPPGSASQTAGAAASPAKTAAPGWRPPSTTPTTMLLLRHGQTALSVDKRFSGIGDPELTDLGREQAEAAGRRLADAGVEAIVCSPLQRARATAEAVARTTGLEVAVEPGLRETDFGDWEGYTFAEVREQWPREMDAWLSSTAVAPPYGESFDATATRVQKARDRVLATYGGKKVVVVSHVTPIKTLLRIALDAPPSALHRMHLDLACLSEVAWFDDGPAVVRSLNDTAHLR